MSNSEKPIVINRKCVLHLSHDDSPNYDVRVYLLGSFVYLHSVEDGLTQFDDFEELRDYFNTHYASGYYVDECHLEKIPSLKALKFWLDQTEIMANYNENLIEDAVNAAIMNELEQERKQKSLLKGEVANIKGALREQRRIQRITKKD